MSIAVSLAETLAVGSDDADADVLPASLRCTLLRLVWVCGDCGEHYTRRAGCPLLCRTCGAPRENFFAPVED